MADTCAFSSYKEQFASRHAAARKSQIRDNSTLKKRPKSRLAAASSGQKTASKTSKTLVDAFKQHGMRLCDGTRLNAVGKGIDALGHIPSTLSAPVTALYLSQNNLKTLEGIEQFVTVRLLSVGGNLISFDDEVVHLNELVHLRNLNLMGNPLCDQPNYRLRVIAMLKKLQVLDNYDITKKEREIAPQIAAQDNVLRTMVMQNHFVIQKLQKIAQMIALHATFYGCVMAGVATGRFDRVPSPKNAACNVPLFLRLWNYEDALSKQEQEALKVQLLKIIVRTHAKLAEHPKLKAKEYLLKLANGSSPRKQRLDSVLSDLRLRCAAWEEAYSNVIALQQKTIANLQAVCEKKRLEMVEYLKDLLSMNPDQRTNLVGSRRWERGADDRGAKALADQKLNQSWRQTAEKSRLSQQKHSHKFASQKQLPPQQRDPDALDKDPQVADARSLPPPPPASMRPSDHHHFPHEKNKSQTKDSSYSCVPNAPTQTKRNRKANLRNGEFANKSLGEAIHTFKLRDAAVVSHQKPVPFSTKSTLGHHAYTLHRQNPIPFPPEQHKQQNSPFLEYSTVSEYQTRTHVTSPTNHDRENDNVHDLSFEERRVSSEFTREDLDMTSISEISHASSSRAQAHDRTEERNGLNEKKIPFPSPSLESTRPSQSDFESHSGLKNPTSPEDGRLYKLEQREEKYIRALMQSEQREIDLRNNLSNVQRKLVSYQRTLSQQLHEREAIKEEMIQRTLAVATPKILKRFFIRWIQFFNWTQRMKHVHRKQCFTLQYNRFWLWRQNVWRQQELKLCLRKHQHRMQTIYFTEWVNAARVSVIAKRNEMVREKRFLARVFQEWLDRIAWIKCERKLQQSRSIHNIQLKYFCEWKRTTRYRRTLKRVQDQRWQDAQRITLQLVFWRWKLFLFAAARPRQERCAQLQCRIEYRQMRLHIREWRKLVDIGKMHNLRLCQRVWKRWIKWRQQVQIEIHTVRNEKVATARRFFNLWHATASERATSRRSLKLAKRYVNRRRLRKLWVHWKYFSMSKRKYTQNSTKALKHYFIRLLRASWGIWKQRTHAHLQRAKASKVGILQRYFDAFRHGIELDRAQKARARLLTHVKKREQQWLLRQIIQSWRRYNTSLKRSKYNAHIVSAQRKQGIRNAIWRRWRSYFVNNLYHQLKTLQKTLDASVHEKHELETHLQAAKDTAASLTDQLEVFNERSKEEDHQIVKLKQTLRLYKEQKAHLEHDLKNAKVATERERRAWEDALCDEDDKREKDSVKYRSIAHENQVLQVQIIELKQEMGAEKAKGRGIETTNEDFRAAAMATASSHHAEMSAAMEKQKELEQEITQLQGHLKEQETEREEAANRLQEYEKRIASICEAMKEHEEAYERENECLRNERITSDVKWKEEQAKNAELRRLLQEKNDLLYNITHDIQEKESPQLEVPSKVPPCHEMHEESNRHEVRIVARKKSCGKPLGRKPDPKSDPRFDPDGFLSSVSPRSNASGVTNLESPMIRYSSMYPFDCNKFAHAQQQAHEVLIDNHTSRVHQDIRLLQERISKRLEQGPAACTPFSPRLIQRRQANVLHSPISSCSSLSNDDSDTADVDQSVADSMRRARIRRLKRQKQAVLLAVSPALSRFAPSVQSCTPPKKREKDDAMSGNWTKKKSDRKTSNVSLKKAEHRIVSKVLKKSKDRRAGVI